MNETDEEDGAVGRRQRDGLIEHLRGSGVLRTDRVADALRAVPRDVFLPVERREDAYVDDAVPIKWDESGTQISSVSQPIIVATMLELLDVRSGDRVLEIGAGSGYNAALLAVLVGSSGAVVSVEIEDDLGERARSSLAAVGVDGVEIVIGDGFHGYEPGAPYDRIVVTTGAPGVAPAWVEQLPDDGRIVVPLVDQQTGVGAIIAVEKRQGALIELATASCGFLPMRRSSTERHNSRSALAAGRVIDQSVRRGEHRV
jgi:protein-L-isoaspartate(D-aspartate) O-methyltransferase